MNINKWANHETGFFKVRYKITGKGPEPTLRESVWDYLLKAGIPVYGWTILEASES